MSLFIQLDKKTHNVHQHINKTRKFSTISFLCLAPSESCSPPDHLLTLPVILLLSHTLLLFQVSVPLAWCWDTSESVLLAATRHVNTQQSHLLWWHSGFKCGNDLNMTEEDSDVQWASSIQLSRDSWRFSVRMIMFITPHRKGGKGVLFLFLFVCTLWR